MNTMLARPHQKNRLRPLSPLFLIVDNSSPPLHRLHHLPKELSRHSPKNWKCRLMLSIGISKQVKGKKIPRKMRKRFPKWESENEFQVNPSQRTRRVGHPHCWAYRRNQSPGHPPRTTLAVFQTRTVDQTKKQPTFVIQRRRILAPKDLWIPRQRIRCRRVHRSLRPAKGAGLWMTKENKRHGRSRAFHCVPL